MSDTPYKWGGEHFCGPDLRDMYYIEMKRIYDPEIGHPVKLDALPDPETFCSACLKWFTQPVNIEGLDLQPPEDAAQ